LDEELKAELSALGPRAVRLQISRLDEKSAGWLSDLKNLELELDLRGRTPEQPELSFLLGLTRLRKVVRVRSDAPMELASALAVVRPVRVVVECVDNRIPYPLLDALGARGTALRLSLDERALPEELAGLARFPNLSVELRFSAVPQLAVSRAESLLKSFQLHLDSP